MRLALKTRKSAGIRVEASVFNRVKRADVARDARQWADAAIHYAAALAVAPRLPHIHIQLGHALKQLCRFCEADAAYAEATRLSVNGTEALLHRAHLAKQMGRLDAAVIHFAAILRLRDDHSEALAELSSLMGDPRPMAMALLRPLLDTIPLAPLSWNQGVASREGDTAETSTPGLEPLVFDITDLIGHFRDQRLPNGIQRVQIEVLGALLARQDDNSFSACCFVSGREFWTEVPLVLFAHLVRLAGMSDDTDEPAWQSARAKLFLHLALSGPYILPWRSVLINLGTSFWVHDYFRFIRNAKAARKIRYMPLVYDMIPIIRPEFCVPGWINDVTTWAVGVFQHADAFLAISNSAKNDLLKVASSLGHLLPEDRVEVVPLDADFRRQTDPLPVSALAERGLRSKRFALLVSTIEPRKNHALAFDAWAELLRRHGPLTVPRLVCVGRDGWMNDEVFDRLDTDATLAEHVTLIHRVSDAELALLYQESAFTIYPSQYEGWGLPVTESLCHGRVPVIADNSSLPEAGGDFALSFVSGSIESLVKAVDLVAFDLPWRAAREAKIAAEFVARPWSQIAEQIASSKTRLLDTSNFTSGVPLASLRTYYPIRLHSSRRIWPGLASGEIFRVGDGWLWPDPDGCIVKSIGGTLRMHLANDAGLPLRIYIHLRALGLTDSEVEISVDDIFIGEGTIRSGKRGWVSCDLPSPIQSELRLTVRGRVDGPPIRSATDQCRQTPAPVAIVGFFLCERDDAQANAEFIQARRGDLRAISAYAEPKPSGKTASTPGYR